MFLKMLAFTFGLLITLFNTADAQPVHLDAEIIADHESVTKGQTFNIGVQFNIDPGWHIYWDNAGDSGFMTQIKWTVNEGVSIIEQNKTPIPQKFNTEDIINYGYKDQTLYVTELKVNEDYTAPTIDITASVNYLICKHVCLPGSAELQRRISIENSSVASKHKTTFDNFYQLQPAKLGSINVTSDYNSTTNTYAIALPEGLSIQEASFIPATEGIINDAVGQQFIKKGNVTTLSILGDDYAKKPAAEIKGILTLDQNSYWIKSSVKVVEAPATLKSIAKTTQAETVTADFNIIDELINNGQLQTTLLLALLGGLILNLMPCVLPVLSLKALSIIHHSKQNRSWWYGLVYTAGILSTFTLLAYVMIQIKASGQDLGWGFQLQSPAFVGTLILILTLVGLQLCSVFNIGSSLGRLQNFVSGHGSIATFFSGMLITVVATPCTAPFMGVAVAYALTQPAEVIYLTFITLGFGLALPYLLITLIPKAHKILPKAGPWEITFQHFLAFPMFATVIWLAYVYAKQTSLDELFLMFVGLFIVTLGASVFGRCNVFSANRKKRWFGVIVFLSSIIYFLYSVHIITLDIDKHDNEIQWQEWSNESVQKGLDQGRPVFVNFTADWCITCKVNEKVAINTENSRKAIERNGVKMLMADWTSKNKTIAEELQKFGRYGVPLYLVYHPNKEEVTILEQILTEDSFVKSIQGE